MSTNGSDTAVLVLRLAAPLQSWGDASTFNRRDTAGQPTKSGIVGLLAAAHGRARTDEISDLGELTLGVRVDQPGSLLRDYHTASDYRGTPLPSASLSAKGTQKPTAPAKYTHVTHRFYLQDAVFIAVLEGERNLIDTLRHAVRRPAFPLALGRRACVPTQPLVLEGSHVDMTAALRDTPWQASEPAKKQLQRSGNPPATVTLATTVDAADHTDIAITAEDGGREAVEVMHDQPVSYAPLTRAHTTRRVRHGWVQVPTGFTDTADTTGTGDPGDTTHDPFNLLGW